ncbi:MAG: N-acetylmuramoyl-L-alanine amidase, partial [Phototrophicales bacterium]|nr:N-acetylmuramoyl-L-alanine amidase [Phototrophicales bacterium]
MKTRYILLSGFLFGTAIALLMTINMPSALVVYAQVEPTPQRTLTPPASQASISLPFATHLQNEIVYDNFVMADNASGLVLSRGFGRGEYLSEVFAVTLTDVAPVLDVGLIFELNQETYNNDAVKISLRGSVDGETWGDWQEQDHFHFDMVGMYSHLVSFDKATRYVQFRIVWDATQITQPIIINLAKINLISAGETPPNVIADNRRSASMGQSVSLPSSAPQPVVSRTGWGCPVGQNSPDWSPEYTNITHFIVHHTVSANSGLDWSAHVRSIWNYHTNSLGWGDIGYNYLIDPDGVIYEGRAGGDGSIGAHFSCMNSRTMGIALIGTFTSVSPSNAAMNSLKNLLAWKATTLNINPQTINYHNPSALNMWTISGHRDGNTSSYGCPGGTSCPGDVLYGLLPSVRADVVQLIVTPTPTRTPTPTIT